MKKTLPRLSEYASRLNDIFETPGEFWHSITNYTNFLTLQRNISHFVPAVIKDGVWLVLGEPKKYNRNIVKPEYGKHLYFSQCGNENWIDGTFEKNTKCILGSCNENFQDNYNKLTSDSEYWIDGNDYDEYQTALDNVVFKNFRVEHNSKFSTWIENGKHTIVFDEKGKVSINNGIEISDIESIITYNLEITDKIAEKFKL